MNALTETIRAELRALASPEKAKNSMRFFKVGAGEYAHGDRFLGITVPEQRLIARLYRDADLETVKELLYSEFHEYRLTALFMLTAQFERQKENRAEIVAFYHRHIERVNNWDLVDSTAYKILGRYYFDKDRSPVFQLAEADDLWQNRIAVVAGMYWIKKDDFDAVLSIIEKLLHHPHDLMHKANGWMLRETGKRDVEVLKNFLNQHAAEMPRTCLRYSIERLTPEERNFYMNMGG